MSRVHVSLVSLLSSALLVGVVGCGGSATPRDASRHPTQPGGAAAPPPPPPPQAYGQPVAPAPMAPPAPAPGLEQQYRLDREAETVEEAERQLAIVEQTLSQQLEADGMGAGRCERACQALASMTRSATRLCELAGDEDDRCAAARDRVEASTRQVDDAGCGC